MNPLDKNLGRKSVIPKHASPKMKYKIRNRRNYPGLKPLGKQTLNYNAKVKKPPVMKVAGKVSFKEFMKNPLYREEQKTQQPSLGQGWSLALEPKKLNELTGSGFNAWNQTLVWE